ncbi:rRNA cytosine-C5-methyltransferase [Paenibacillus mesophilus]|uniref:RsmF rRNA methyltransferase first C-terminal domain-containing protein n=1 Tax=Paenibacillus mesophilus TaxID=2582849 RepID=UPI00110DF120|nr:RsmB/NOP family class I SAM-dependent RNA methyltransferase [Paenibacillus mesophilus]TMV47801.1 rRNA cytosine-C5-methyltransferase [Paenibacillus mesophilus]
MAKLPDLFLKKMEQLLQDEYPAFLSSYEQSRLQGIRVNGLKMEAERFPGLSPFPLSQVPWVREGFYIPETERPGKHPYYHAGLYYVQEPSAMAPVELLDVRPGDKVLDLCAAPGGKTTQIASKLQGRGLLVTNDNQPDRVKALVKNVELYGVTNAIVLNETPERLAPVLPDYFDKILVDAPCSGEGMFRKDDSMAKGWDGLSPLRYAAMQRHILAKAADMLKPGGRIVYSTCTFSPEENERIIADFAAEHPGFRVVPIPAEHGFEHGRPDWTGSGRCEDGHCQETAGTVRLWPHRLKGEGHFAAVLERTGVRIGPESVNVSAQPVNRSESRMPEGRMKRTFGEKEGRMAGKHGAKGKGMNGERGGTSRLESGSSADGSELLRLFAEANLTAGLSGKVKLHRDYVYISPEEAPDLDGLKVVRPGWFAGTVKGGRFEPSHALAMGLKRGADAVRSISFESGDLDAVRYLKGETLQLSEERLCLNRPGMPAKGYCLVCVDGYPLGWGKWMDGMLKNEYPPGWRWS